MKNKLIYCKNCNRIFKEKITLKKRFFQTQKFLFLTFLCLTSLFGTTALYNLVSGGIYENYYDILSSVGGFYATIINVKSNFKSNDELKEIAINLTKECEDDYCKSKKIYNHLLTFNYELGTNLNAYEVYKEGEFDCDEGSYLLKIMLSKVGVDSIIQCIQDHCYLIIKLEEINILADLTQYQWEEF